MTFPQNSQKCFLSFGTADVSEPALFNIGYSADGNSIFLWNIGTSLPEHTASRKIPVAVRSEALVCSRLLEGIAGLHLAEVMECLLYVVQVATLRRADHSSEESYRVCVVEKPQQ